MFLNVDGMKNGGPLKKNEIGYMLLSYLSSPIVWKTVKNCFATGVTELFSNIWAYIHFRLLSILYNLVPSTIKYPGAYTVNID